MKDQDRTAKDRSPPYPVADAEDTNVARPPVPGEMPLPFERDEAPERRPKPGEKAPQPIVEQAARDAERGLRDTSRGVPSDVPAEGANPETTPGADVPEDGIDQRRSPLNREGGPKPQG